MSTPANFITMPSTLSVVNALVACLSHRNIDQFATICRVRRPDICMVRVCYVYVTYMLRVLYVYGTYMVRYGTCVVPNFCFI